VTAGCWTRAGGGVYLVEVDIEIAVPAGEAKSWRFSMLIMLLVYGVVLWKA
jgi:hypothetical protein